MLGNTNRVNTNAGSCSSKSHFRTELCPVPLIFRNTAAKGSSVADLKILERKVLNIEEKVANPNGEIAIDPAIFAAL